MTSADLTALQRNLRQLLPDEGISAVLAALKKTLPEQTDKYNAVFQLETRLNATNRDRLRGILSMEQLDLAYNRISAELLDLIDALEIEDFDIATADEPEHVNKTGSILYRIPHIMEVEQEYRCIVRLAFEDEVIIRNIEITRDTVLKEVRVAEVMEVELLDPNELPAFGIRRLNSAEQFLEKHDYTEWIFFVKPLRTGQLPLVLKVAVLEIIDNHERKKEIVLEEVIHVVADAPEPGAPGGEGPGFKNAGYSIATGNAATGSRALPPSPPAATPPQSVPAPATAPAPRAGGRRSAMAMILLLVIAVGIWAAGRYAGWWSGPEPVSETQVDQEDWDTALRGGTKEAFGTYLEKHPEGLFKLVARYKLDSIQRAETISRDTSTFLQNNNVKKDTPGLRMIDSPSSGKTNSGTPVSKRPKTKPPLTPNKQPQAPQPPAPAPTTLPEAPQPPLSRTRKSGFEMVQVLGGTMNIGCESGSKDECPHPVTVASFKIGRYEVTQADWRDVMGRNPAHFNYSGCDECPVEQVSWNEVQAFVKKANEKFGTRFRLPYEAEWEYAARGGAQSKGFKYAGSNKSGTIGWNHGNSEEPHRVGQKKPNELGLYDMTGNVWEWCLDTYKPYPGCKSRTTDDRIIRGGSFRNYDSKCRTCNRNYKWPADKDYTVGFRLASE